MLGPASHFSFFVAKKKGDKVRNINCFNQAVALGHSVTKATVVHIFVSVSLLMVVY